MESKSTLPTILDGKSAPGMVKEFMVGAAGGITQVIIGQPFDIVKVRMQTQVNGNAIQVARKILTHEGVLGFYKGSLPPLLGVGACISIVYSVFHSVSRSLQSFNHHATLSLTTPQTYLAGGISGLANSFISGPTEHIRIRLQTQSSTSNGLRTYSGVYDCVQKIVSTGGLRSLYRGQTPTMLREFHSYGIWFSVYELLMSQVAGCENMSREGIPSWKIAGCGIVTGVVLWAANYPIDVVKSKMQADGFGEERKYRNMRDVVRQTWRHDRLHGFFRGLGPTLVRAVPVSAGTFLVVETVRKVL
ncbi:mitochondrial carnitine/acylcarnitine carrier protein [Talaromyces proteolyticus]|uniref:Mitochondrial carnitine/acylcarnitine carrier protein n=1 Tax=Talaromyces proteolyticus TaxID=1131652 RepID=A0AAD4KUE7_9EURO|nr:mitochondrial carnitine/acylcarnitine carrier protein [Talaromyces proteolyticus]KAH8700210.1 mitochondrial carnitine/acylcarnitine carrier protein [Talaromyces proteolyticus]